MYYLDAYKTSILISLFREDDKVGPNNYRGINLLNTTLKLTKKTIVMLLYDLIG